MNATETIVKQKNYDAGATRVAMKLEVEVVPVSDVDRAKEFYQQKLGWRLDTDDIPGEGFRIGGEARGIEGDGAERIAEDTADQCCLDRLLGWDRRYRIKSYHFPLTENKR